MCVCIGASSHECQLSPVKTYLLGCSFELVYRVDSVKSAKRAQIAAVFDSVTIIAVARII